MEQNFVTAADGTRIAWYDFGGSGSQTLVLGHATGFCGRIWEPLLPVLQNSFRCVAYDLRGHGASASPAEGREGFDWLRYGDDLLRVLDAAHVGVAYGLGHSCGGATMLLAEQQRPGTFAAMWLYEPVVFPVDPPTGPDPDRDLAVRTLKRRRSFTSREEARSNFAEKGPFAKLDARALDAYVQHGFVESADGVELACSPEDEADVYVMASGHPGYTRLAEVECPVVVARGTDSRSFSDDEMDAVAERLPRGLYVQYEGLGHFGPLENPEEIAEDASAFLTEA